MALANKLLFLLALFSMYSCSNRNAGDSTSRQVVEQYTVYYAKGFEVKKYEDFTEVSVRNPWDTLQLLQKYFLVDKKKPLPSHLPKGVVVRTPLDDVVAYSTIHCSTLKELNSIQIIKGVCESNYIQATEIKQGISAGTILDLGSPSGADIEKLIMLAPEAILASPINGQTYGSVTKTKIPIIETPDYTEPHPLGRAEWVRFYSLFIGKEQLADSLFKITEKNYNAIKSKVMNRADAPTVFTDMRYRGVWQMPGGCSYMAHMLKDAGGKYVWQEDASTTFLPLPFETVLDKAGNADVWLIRYFAGDDLSYTNLKREYRGYTYFKSYKEQNVWGCNTSYSGYYEDLPIHPDYILKEFAAIFYPHLFPDYIPRYYKKFEE